MNERGLRQMILHRSVRLSDGQSRSSTQCDFFFFSVQDYQNVIWISWLTFAEQVRITELPNPCLGT